LASLATIAHLLTVLAVGVSVGKGSLAAIFCHRAAVGAAHGPHRWRCEDHDNNRVGRTEVAPAHGRVLLGFRV
jgi:hypothetical protein